MAPLNTTNPRSPNQTNSAKPPATRPSPSKTPSVNGIGRSSSVRGGPTRPGRGGVGRSSPQTSFLNTSITADDASDDDVRAERAALMDELRNRVQKAETASEEYQRQLNLLQARLDESQQSHGRLEDQVHEKNVKIEELEADKVQVARQQRDLGNIFDSERAALMKDKDEQLAKEEELQATIQRLKESLAQRESRNSSVDEGKDLTEASNGQFAPSSSLQRSDSKNKSKVIAQKDRVIESLRLEVAEAQIKIMEMDSMGGGQIHELEKKLMEARITNARLTEDNESFQLLLSEKTLNGDFSKTETMQTSTGLGSLAEELGSEELESAEGKSEECRRLEVEVKSLKDQNKALAVYIESIIGRLLQHKEFENLLDKTPDLMSGAPRSQNPNPQNATSQAVNIDKDLPPPPPPKDTEAPPQHPGGFLQRARSVVAGPSKPRPRPISQTQQPPPTAPPQLPTTPPISDPSKAPSIPLARSQSSRTNHHRRSQSDMPAGAPLVNQMYRGPTSTAGAVAPMMSPGISPASNTRSSFFSPPPPPPPPPTHANANPIPRVASRTHSPIPFDRPPQQPPNPGSSSNSTFSDLSGGGGGTTSLGGMDGSPPRSNPGGSNNYPGAVMTQSRLRPLRLVQESRDAESVREREEEAERAKKKANRGSWMPAAWSWAGGRTISGGAE